MLTRTGTHDYPPCGRAWAGIGAIAREFDRGTGLANSATMFGATHHRAVVIAAPGAFRLDSLPPTPGLVRRNVGVQLPEVPARGQVWPPWTHQISFCSEISRASSTSMPRYPTVDSSLESPRSSCAALRFLVRRWINVALVLRIGCVPQSARSSPISTHGPGQERSLPDCAQSRRRDGRNVPRSLRHGPPTPCTASSIDPRQRCERQRRA